MVAQLIGDETSMGACLSTLLNSHAYNKLSIMVAFAKQSAIGRMNVHLMNFRNSGSTLEAIIGIDHHVTTYQAIEQLKNLSDNNTYIHHDRGFSDFHPKFFIFERNNNNKDILIGSSNLTVGGLFSNYEANVLLTPTGTAEDVNFIQEIDNYYNSVKTNANTQRVTTQLLTQLFQQGLLINEITTRSFSSIINRVSDIPFSGRRRASVPRAVTAVPEVPIRTPTMFTMLLSRFDVSSRSQDPVILIPITALKHYPIFWQWWSSFDLSGAGYPERYTTAIVNIPDNEGQRWHIRLYYYDRKREFRLQCEPIKRNGQPGDIVVIEKINSGSEEYEISLIPQASNRYGRFRRICNTRVSAQKYFGYQ